MDLIDWQAFHFLRPLALLGLIPTVLLGAWHLLQRPKAAALESLLSDKLRDVLLSSAKGMNRWAAPALIVAVLGLGSVAVAGPTWKRQQLPARELEDPLVVLFDLSLSMYAQDLQPSRLVRAQLELTDLLGLRQEGTTGLIAYAGDAHVVTPLTDDVETIRHMAKSLSPDIMPVLGSRTEQSIELANQLIARAAHDTGRILLITDGIGELETSARACDPKYPVSILGVGTPLGAPIAVPTRQGQTVLLTDAAGDQIIAKLEEPKLRDLARLCGGSYRLAQLGDEDLTAILPELTEIASGLRQAEESQQLDMWVDMTYLFALPLIPLILVAFRRGALPVILFFVFAVPDASASWWDDIWKRSDQQGYQALQKDDPEAAAALFSDERWRGVSEFRTGAYTDAASSFAGIKSKTADDLYNLGTSHAHEGQIQEAIQALTQALEIDPSHESAAHNKRVLEAFLANQPKQAPDQEDGQESESDSRMQDSQSSNNSQDSAEGEEDRQRGGQDSDTAANEHDQDSQESESNTEQQDNDEEREQTEHLASASDPLPASQEEVERARQRERVESLLRRVPDDPGGLLRQKFLYEARRREESGQPRVDSEQAW